MSQQKELTARVVECVVATNETLTDYSQRSALGMARTFARDRKAVAVAVNSLDLKPRRDALAVDLVKLLEEHSEKECVIALEAARKVVNAPFQVGRFVGSKGAGVLNKPGPKKKAGDTK